MATNYRETGWSEWNTGGGCLALRRNDSRDQYLLITDADGNGLPDPDGSPVIVGKYDTNDMLWEKEFPDLDSALIFADSTVGDCIDIVTNLPDDILSIPATSQVGSAIIALCDAAAAMMQQMDEPDALASVMSAIQDQAEVWYYG